MRQDDTVDEVQRLRIIAENEQLRDLLRRLIDNVETGSYESTGQCIDECKRFLGIADVRG